MGDWSSMLTSYLTAERALPLLRAMVLLAVGFVLGRTLSASLPRLARKYLDAQQTMLVRRISFYLVFGLFLISALRELGFNLSVLLGAAGILSVAIGFASQTSASNLISGLFLIAERPFSIGDVIRVGTTTGEVLSIDLLSVKLRTFDNLYVRLPNEIVIKSEVVNLTKFPIRRIDLQLGVAYKEDISKVRQALLAVANENPLCLDEPQPLFIFRGFGDSALDIQFSVWAQRDNFLDLKNSILDEIKRRFDAEGIEIPFPHRTVEAAGEPFPVRIVADER